MSNNEMQFESTTISEEPVMAEKKRSGKKGLIIGVAVLAAVILLAAIVIGVLSSSPLGLIATGFQNSMEALESNPTLTMMNKVSNGGSTEVAMDLKSLLSGSEVALDGTVSVKAYTDSEAQKSVLSLGVKLGQAQNLDASIFMSPDNVVLGSQWLLGDKAYGINLQTLVEDFNKSVFRMGGPYSLDIELPENLQTQLADSQKFAESSEKIVAEMMPRLLKSLEKNSTVEKENASLTLGGEEVKTTAVAVKMDHQQLSAFAAEVLDYLRTDEEFKKYLEENKAYLFQAYGMYGEFDDANAFVEDFYRELDQAAAEMEETAKEMEELDASLAVTFHITKSGKQLIGMELTVADKEETTQLRFCAGPDLKEAEEILFYMDDNGQVAEGSYLVKVNDENAFFSILDLSENGQAVLKADIRWDKQTGKLELTAADDQEESFSLQGTLELTDDKATAVLENISNGSETVNLGISLVLRTSDEIPATPQYTELLKMTEAEVDSLVEDLGAVILQLMYGMA